jgi:peroxiredoxin
MRIGYGKLAALALGVFVLLAGPGGSSAQEKDKALTPPPGGGAAAETPKMPLVGSLAPEFSLKDTDGFPYHFAEQRGRKAVLLVFWSMFCEPCRLELALVQKVHARHWNDGLEVVAVSVDGEALRSSIQGFVRQEGYAFRVLIDEPDAREAFKAADPYGVAGTPALFLVDRGGKIALAKAGRTKEDELEKAVQAVLKR